MKSPQLKTPEAWANKLSRDNDGEDLTYGQTCILIEEVREEYKKNLLERVQALKAASTATQGYAYDTVISIINEEA